MVRITQAPCSALVGKDTKFNLPPIQYFNFRLLKDKLILAPVLHYLMRDSSYKIEPNALKVVIGGVI